MKAAILTDVTMCVGCEECVRACKEQWNLESDVPRRWDKPDGLSARNWTSIVYNEGRFIRKQCRHCEEPACQSVCPVHAYDKTPEGPVLFNAKKCMGCRYCMMACPYGIPRYDWDKAVPYIQKCIMCYPRLKEGQQPACTEACPYGATVFFENREDALAEAHRRIKENPGQYIDHVWGEHEVGGTSVLYISDVDLSILSETRKPLGPDPLPEKTAPAMLAVPFAFVGMGITMASIRWIITRRMELQNKNQNDGEEGHE